MQVSSSSYASLLDYINSQSDDTSSKGLGKAGGISSLLQQNCVASNPVLTKIDEKYGKTAAQTALRFLLQNDVVIIPKSVHKDRMQQNFDLFN